MHVRLHLELGFFLNLCTLGLDVPEIGRSGALHRFKNDGREVQRMASIHRFYGLVSKNKLFICSNKFLLFRVREVTLPIV